MASHHENGTGGTGNGTNPAADPALQSAAHAGTNGAQPTGAAPGAASPVRSLPTARASVHDSAWVASPPFGPAGTAADESVDVGQLARQVGRGWRTLLTGAAVGVLVGGAVVLLVRPWYRGAASVLVRNANDPTGSLLSRFGLAGDVAGAAAGGALGGVLKSSLETEVQLLQSRELVGMVVDSLALQARVLEPRGMPARALFATGPIGGAFRRRVVTFQRQADGQYQATGGGTLGTLAPGRPGSLSGIGRVTLAAGVLPAAFRVRLEDREDAITRAVSDLTVEKLGGDVVKLRYDGPDSSTAAAVPNAAIDAYLALRRTVDRGLNARRYEFMAAQADSAARELADAESALRREQEASGVVDPEVVGRSALEAVQEVRNELVPLEAERRAAHALVAAVERGALTPRELTAFPSFLRAPAVSSILDQITRLEAQRTQLLGTRTERDPDVAVLTQSIVGLERNLLPIARTYATSLDRQTAELAGEQRAVEGRLSALPGQAERALRLQREVKRLSGVVLGLSAQMIDARLAALGEGGQVRQVDVAVAPKRPLFPRAVWVLPGGLLLGVLGAVAVVLGRSAWSRRVRSADDVARATGLPAVAARPGAPLLVGGMGEATVLVLGVEGRSDTRSVADALASQARARGLNTAVVDMTAAAGDGSLYAAVRGAEAEHDAVFVAGSGLDDVRLSALLDAGRAATLVAVDGVTTRDGLAGAASTLARYRVPVLGVVMIPRRPQ